MSNRINELKDCSSAYRAIVDRIFSTSLSGPHECRQYFFDLLLIVSRLYLASILLVDELSNVKGVKDRSTSPLPSTNVARFIESARHFRERLESLACWKYFRPMRGVPEAAGLVTVKDYQDSFTLHLPEIYEETFQIDQYVEKLLRLITDSAIAGVIVTVEHVCYHHVSFVLPALQWASREASWLEKAQLQAALTSSGQKLTAKPHRGTR